MRRGDWKDILVSILVGALVAFLTTFLEGLLKALNGFENNALGGISAAAYRIIKHMV